MHPAPPSAVHLASRAQRLEELRAGIEASLPCDSALTLEVGSGHGHFLSAYAAAHPERTCVGIDLSSDRYERSERKKHRARLANLHFFRADVFDFFEVLPPRLRLAEAFVLFPDPWPKRRHHKNRVLNARFLGELAARSTSEARLYFRTDHDGYFDASRKVVAQHPGWALDPAAPWPFELPTVFQLRAPSYQSWIARRSA